MAQEKITILDKEYLVACEPDERPALHESARMVDNKMREIRASGKTIGTERVAVMAALNIAHELLEEMSGEQAHDQSLKTRIKLMQDKIDSILSDEDRQLTL